MNRETGLARACRMLPFKKEKAPENQGLDLIHLPGDARGRRTGHHSHSIINEEYNTLNPSGIILISQIHTIKISVAGGPMLDLVVGANQDGQAGFIATVPAQRVATPREVADLVLFLGSEAHIDPPQRSAPCI